MFFSLVLQMVWTKEKHGVTNCNEWGGKVEVYPNVRRLANGWHQWGFLIAVVGNSEGKYFSY